MTQLQPISSRVRKWGDSAWIGNLTPAEERRLQEIFCELGTCCDDDVPDEFDSWLLGLDVIDAVIMLASTAKLLNDYRLILEAIITGKYGGVTAIDYTPNERLSKLAKIKAELVRRRASSPWPQQCPFSS